MKKFITSILIAAAALTACSKSEEITPNIIQDKVVLSATIDAPQSRSVLVEEAGKYHAEWVAGDYLELYEITITGGTKKKASNPNTTLTEGGKTATVQFELTANTTADSFAYILAHNNASINGAATYLAFSVPNNQAPTAMNTYDPTADLILSKGVSLATQPTETVNFEMARMTALAKVTIKNLALAAGDAVKSVNFICPKNISGKMTNILTDDIIAGNYPLAGMKDSSPVYNNVTVTLPEAQTGDFSYYMSVWPVTLDAGSACTVVVATNNDGVYTKEITLPKVMELTSGNITAFTVNMAGIKNSNATPEQPVEQPKYVTVAGIKWATGNLEYEKDTTTDGFAAGWSLTETQYSYIYMEQNGDLTNLTNYDKTNYFNWGGIADPFSVAKTSAISMATSEPAFDYSGKMYTDQACTVATTDFAAAQFGDVAYWASNGKYRTPTAVDFQKLYNEACRTKATYTAGTVTINGTYYYNPGEGETAGVVDGTKVLTADDLAVGIFLPWAGRGYDGTEYNVYKIGAQGVYRTSTVNTTSTTDATNGLIYRVQSLTEGAYYHKSYGATARYLIRPIYIE
ncbi:MAG: hypothetical protein IIX34_02985 [Alistipes sp.]|nr:hypothetical protein [Alistipes sp.]